MTGRVKKHILFTALLMMLTGCATNMQKNNITPALLAAKPDIEIETDLTFSFSNVRTFTVVSASALLGSKARINSSIEEMHLQFMLRNSLEGRGYKFVAPGKSPDLIATIDGFSNYQSSHTRQSLLIKPSWRLGDEYSLFNQNPDLLELAAISNAGHVSGNYFSGSLESAGISDALAVSSSPQGLLGGVYYPQVAITLFDNKSQKTIWYGLGAGTSTNQNFRVASQLLIRFLVKQIPLSKYRLDVFPRNTGKIGIGYAIASIDGQNYYPLLTGVSDASPANKAGIKSADFLIEINGEATLNKSTGEVAELLAGEACTILKLKIWRMGQSFDLGIERVSRLNAGQQNMTAQSSSVLAQKTRQHTYVLYPEFSDLVSLSKEAQQELNAFVETFKGINVTQLNVVAHTDSSPVIRPRSRRLFQDNLVLSQARAKRVADYLQRALKLSNEQVVEQGRGSSEPVADNSTAAGRLKNRRVEITVTRSVNTERSGSCG